MTYSFWFCRFSLLCCFNHDYCVCTHIPCHSGVWTNAYYGLHWSLLIGGIFIGMSLCWVYLKKHYILEQISKKCQLQVMSVKALGIAVKLTLSGINQLIYPQTWAFSMIVAACIITQMNYLNKVTTYKCLLYHSLCLFFLLINAFSIFLFLCAFLLLQTSVFEFPKVTCIPATPCVFLSCYSHFQFELFSFC